jgi:hypothetical protein
MEILILAITHDHQRVLVGSELELPDLARKTDAFRSLIVKNISNFRPSLICEETSPAYLSIAQHEAFYNIPRIPWRNINMSPQERLEAGIWKAYIERPFDFDFNSGTTTYHRIPEDEVREAFFKDEILNAAGEIRANRVLVVCGAMHVESLASKLRVNGHEVKINDEFIAEQNWK